ncbi:16230_t:CDS:2, partial [Dentiscutata erythropus]
GEFWKNKDIGKMYDFFKPGVTRFDNTNNDIQRKPTSDGILSFGCDKQKGEFSPNIAWIVTVTVDPLALQEKIDNTLLANMTTNKDEPIDLEDALFFGIEQ